MEGNVVASVNKDSKGWRIQFVNKDGDRKTLRPGKGTNKATAEQTGRFIDLLVAHTCSQGILDRQTAIWLGKIGDRLHAKLVKFELTERRVVVEPEPEPAQRRRLADSLEYHINRGKTKTGRPASEGTIMKWRAAEGHLNAFFGARAIDSITVEDAENFRDWLGEKTKKNGDPFSENNIRSIISSAKMFFNAAKRRKWVPDNAFENEVSGTQENKERSVHVNRETAELVLDACPDTQWKLMFALWRYAGLRKMEIFGLRWEHVLWDECLMVVPSSKTAHHAGREERIIPIVEILPYLELAFNEAAEGTERIITRYDESNSNLDKPFRQILTNAGVVPWPKAFQNLRASCETDWLDWVGPNGERNSAHVVASWVGHSIKVQNKHYAQVDRHHFEQFNRAVAHQVAQNVREPGRTKKNTEEGETEKAADFPARSAQCASVRSNQTTRPGLEPGITESKSVVLPITLSGYVLRSRILGLI